MSSPSKIGLDYFSFDVDLLADRKFRKVRLKHGYMGVMVFISLLTLIYKDKGYYIDYSNPGDVHWDILDDLKGKFQPTAETVAEVIEDLVACELFSGDQFKSKILTSKRIQANYYKATVERKTVSINSDIWELTFEEIQKLSAKHSYYLFLKDCENRPINKENRPINKENRPINQQSKVKESKVKESKVSSSANADIEGFATEWNAYIQMRKEIKKPLTTNAVALALDKLEKLANGDVEKKKAILNQSILHSWQGLFEIKKEVAYKKTEPGQDREPSFDIELFHSLTGIREEK